MIDTTSEWRTIHLTFEELAALLRRVADIPAEFTVSSVSNQHPQRLSIQFLRSTTKGNI